MSLLYGHIYYIVALLFIRDLVPAESCSVPEGFKALVACYALSSTVAVIELLMLLPLP